MLHILGASVNILGKLRAVLETPKKILEGLGCVKGHTFYKYEYFIHLASFALVRYENVYESKEAR